MSRSNLPNLTVSPAVITWYIAQGWCCDYLCARAGSVHYDRHDGPARFGTIIHTTQDDLTEGATNIPCFVLAPDMPMMVIRQAQLNVTSVADEFDYSDMPELQAVTDDEPDYNLAACRVQNRRRRAHMSKRGWWFIPSS
ncbi:hypothetical protein K438DRAFT_1764111 [Mycena galopus ATCC 62051]|nr:hypothetical protein K438DRAFT_1764111 [Mycena galopus ATCC 62051]